MSRRHGEKLLLAALLALSLPVLAACIRRPERPATEDDQTPTETPQETSEEEVPNTPEETETPEPGETHPAEMKKTVRVAIKLTTPSVTQMGYSLGTIASDPEAQAYQARLCEEQDEMIRRIEDCLGHPLDVRQRLTLSTNVISAEVYPMEIEMIRAMDGVKGVTEETRNDPTSGVSVIPGKTARG